MDDLNNLGETTRTSTRTCTSQHRTIPSDHEHGWSIGQAEMPQPATWCRADAADAADALQRQAGEPQRVQSVRGLSWHLGVEG